MTGGSAHAETLARGDFSLALPTGFVSEGGTPLLDGQWAAGRHAGSGGGWAIRSLDAARYLAVKGRVAGRVDVDAALSADRFAMLALQEVKGDDDLRTLYVGPADGVAAQVGRWVYTASDGAHERLVWWHVFWRTADAYVELSVWAPLSQLAVLNADMRQVEALGHTGAAPAETLLFESGQEGCGPPLHADRSAAIRATRRFGDAREVLRGGHAAAQAQLDPALDPGVGLRLSEHRATAVLYRHAEACVHEAARARRVCTVLEGPVKGPRSQALQDQVVACLDADAALSRELTQAVEAVWASH